MDVKELEKQSRALFYIRSTLYQLTVNLEEFSKANEKYHQKNHEILSQLHDEIFRLTATEIRKEPVELIEGPDEAL